MSSSSLKKSTKPKSKASKGKKAKFPAPLAPMLATLVDKPFDNEDWLYEVKWDGYRAIAHVNKQKVELKSRNNKSFNEKFYPVYDALKNLKVNVVLDGEVIAATEKKTSDFGALQNWRTEKDGELLYYIFDILWLDGYSLVDLTLLERRKVLADTIKENDCIRISEAFDTDGNSFFKAAEKMHLEGIIAKKKDSLYVPGIRSKDWLKIKTAKRHEVIIGGYTQNEGSVKKFSSLLVGVLKRNKLHYIGKIGTGFTDDLQAKLLKQFKPFIRKLSPFSEEPNVNKKSRFRPNPPKAITTWLTPQLVCEVSYTEMTSDGVMRHPSFEGMRTDKKASEVKEEKTTGVKKIVKKK